MSIDRIVFAVAGIFIMASVALGIWHHEYWFGFTAFVGFNMFQAAFTGFCPMAMILKMFGAKSGKAFS